MQAILENYFEQYQLQAECHSQNEGKSITVRYPLGEGEWAMNTIQFDDDKMFICVWNSLSNSTWDIVQRFQEGVPKSMEKIFPRMFQFWGFLLQQKPNIRALLIKVDTTNFGSNAFNILRDSQFIQLSRANTAFIAGHYGQEVNWLGRFAEDSVTKSLLLAATIETFLQEKQQQDPTIEVNWDYKKHTLYLSYRGTDVAMDTAISAGNLVLTWAEQAYIVSNETEGQQVMETIFQTLEANQAPSTKHYEAFMKDVHVRTSYVQSIHERLLKDYTWLEIETFAAKRKKRIEEAKKAVLYAEEMKLLRYLHHFIVLDYETNEIAVYKEKEQAISVFKEQVLKKKEQKLEQQIKQFLYETDQPD